MLLNPVQWAGGAKGHAPELYRALTYNRSLVDTNPFVRGLLESKADGSGFKFARGEMIKLTVENAPANEHETSRIGGDPHRKKHWIIPILNDAMTLDKYYYTSHYIVNNSRYVDYVANDRSKSLRFFPRKLAALNGAMRGDTSFIPGVRDVVESLYIGTIKALLKDASESDLHPSAGMILSTLGKMFELVDSIPKVNLKLLIEDVQIKDMFVRYETNPDLCQQVMLLANYKS